MKLKDKRNEAGSILFPVIMFCLLLIGILGVFILVLRQQESHDSTETTAPPLLKFAAVGDFSSTPETEEVLKLISRQKTDLTLALGDLSYSTTPTEKDWCAFVSKRLGEKYPFLLVAGNHDTDKGVKGEYEDSIEKYSECLPGNTEGISGVYGQQYYFDQKNKVRFIAISPDLTIGGKSYNYKKGESGYMWVADAIHDARNKNIPWIVVYMHKNCISVGTKTCEIGTDILDLLIKEKVPVVLQGHDHTYQRSKPLKFSNACPEILDGIANPDCASSVGDTYDASEGTTILINGTGGKELYNINKADEESVYFRTTSGANKNPSHGSIFVEVYGNHLDITYKTTANKILDRFTITK